MRGIFSCRAKNANQREEEMTFQLENVLLFNCLDVILCQDFRSPFGTLVDCDNRTTENTCSDEQRLLYFLMK